MERISVELTNRCQKACWFCYNHSNTRGATRWTVADVVTFVSDCARHDTRAVSFGGGEPLQFPGWEDILTQLRGVLFRSITTNGLLLDESNLCRLVAAAPDKVHVSIHFPEQPTEVERVIRQVQQLQENGIRSGINFLIAHSKLDVAHEAAAKVRAAGIGNDRIVYLPMRGQDTPSPREVAEVAGVPFQSMTCLTRCDKSPRFCTVAWDQTVGWCSYTTTRRPLPALTYAGLYSVLDGLGLTFCGDGNGPRFSSRP